MVKVVVPGLERIAVEYYEKPTERDYCRGFVTLFFSSKLAADVFFKHYNASKGKTHNHPVTEPRQSGDSFFIRICADLKDKFSFSRRNANDVLGHLNDWYEVPQNATLAYHNSAGVKLFSDSFAIDKLSTRCFTPSKFTNIIEKRKMVTQIAVLFGSDVKIRLVSGNTSDTKCVRFNCADKQAANELRKILREIIGNSSKWHKHKFEKTLFKEENAFILEYKGFNLTDLLSKALEAKTGLTDDPAPQDSAGPAASSGF